MCPGLSQLGDSFAFPQVLGKPSMPEGLARGMLLLPQFQSNLLQSRDGQSAKQRGLGQWLFFQKVLQIKCYSLDDWPLTKMPGDFPIMLLYVRKASCDRGALISVIGRKCQFWLCICFLSFLRLVIQNYL